MLAALDKGYQLDTQFYSPHRYTTRFIVEPGGPSACGNRWCPKNASASMAGVRDMHTGFGMSVNTYFAQLVEKVGPTAAVRMAERLGLRWRNSVDQQLAKNPSGWGAFTLGAPDTTPMEMANAYATAAAGGTYCEATPVEKIIDRDGKPVAPPHKCKRAFSQDVAWAATDAARCPVGEKPARGSCGGWGTATRVGGIVPGPVAGKTGTTDSNRAAWFVGYNRQLAGAAFLADPDYRLADVPSDGPRFPTSVVAFTLRDFMKGKDRIKFGVPSREISDGGKRATAPRKSGRDGDGGGDGAGDGGPDNEWGRPGGRGRD
jgi:membrane peptidoglycan carboxypeptidase